jgi:hypothetical protein
LRKSSWNFPSGQPISTPPHSRTTWRHFKCRSWISTEPVSGSTYPGPQPDSHRN